MKSNSTDAQICQRYPFLVTRAHEDWSLGVCSTDAQICHPNCVTICVGAWKYLAPGGPPLHPEKSGLSSRMICRCLFTGPSSSELKLMSGDRTRFFSFSISATRERDKSIAFWITTICFSSVSIFFNLSFRAVMTCW